MCKVDTSFEFYGDYQINIICNVFKSKAGVEKIFIYNVFSCETGFVGTFDSIVEARQSIVNNRKEVLSK